MKEGGMVSLWPIKLWARYPKIFNRYTVNPRTFYEVFNVNKYHYYNI